MEIRDTLYGVIDSYLDSEDYTEETALIKNDYFGKDAVVAYLPAWRVDDKGVIFVEGVYRLGFRQVCLLRTGYANYCNS